MVRFSQLKLLASGLGIVCSRAVSLQSSVHGSQAVLGLADNQQAPSSASPLTADSSNIDKNDWMDVSEYIRTFMKEWHITGVSVAVKDGQKNISWAEAFGYADRSTFEPMTTQHMTFTGSTGKSFISAALSLLVDNSAEYKNLKWTTPISSLLPEDFILSDPWATQHITIEDALTHRTGLPAHDMAWVPTTRDLVRGLRHLPLSAEPRTKFQYSNKMYGVLGYLLEKLTGLTLREVLHKYLLQPLGMRETFFGLRDAQASGVPLAKCYHWSETLGRHVRVPYELDPADAAAGDMVSNVLDYTTWLQAMMAGAGPVSPAGHFEIKKPRILAKLSQPPFVGPVFYSLGWYTGFFSSSSSLGEQVWWHTGQTADFLTFVIMVPARKVSVVVLINQRETAFEAIAYRLLYDILEVPEEERIDFDAVMKERAREKKETLKSCPKQAYPSLPTRPLPPAVPLESYAGAYEHIGYGQVSLALDCDTPAASEHQPPISPPTIEDDKTCRLRLTRRDDAYPHVIVDLVHQSGEYWLGWLTYGEWQDPETPLTCVRAEFRIGPDGQVVQFGIDFRLEGVDTELVWYDRVIG